MTAGKGLAFPETRAALRRLQLAWLEYRRAVHLQRYSKVLAKLVTLYEEPL